MQEVSSIYQQKNSFKKKIGLPCTLHIISYALYSVFELNLLKKFNKITKNGPLTISKQSPLHSNCFARPCGQGMNGI